jgi:trans-2,3-dihydro-3-hydroxyanthranilate isomerase
VRAFRYVIADVFTDTPLAGNQLAVFTDARDLDEVTMQRLALEIGFSETVYVLPAREGGHARIRIFTPMTELPFAGHPTLGSAFVLAAPLQLETIALETAVGIVPVQLDRDESGRIVFGRMVQPVPTVTPFERSADVLAALSVERSELPVELYDNGVRFVYVMLASEEAVAAVNPDMRGLMGNDLVGVNVFAGEGKRWKTRMFSPIDGVGEDAATGSAAGPLACHLARHGAIAWGDEIEISQGAEIGRPSTLYARASGSDDGIESVEVGGSAVTVARGEFRIP